MPNMLNAAQTAEFNQKGFTYARGLFAPDEVKLLTDAMEQDPAVRSSILDRRDGEGRSTRIALWNRAGDSVYGLAARCERMVDTSAHLLGGDIYHYQSKLTAKEPEVGGAWEWHQDYGYWYYNGCLRPDLLSVMIALDKTDRNNGCLQIATGSHRLGRIDHTPLSPTQNEVDPKRMPLHPRAVPDRALRARGRRRADLPLQRHPPLRRQPLGQPALDAADLLQPGRQRHDHQGRRPLFRAARQGRRRGVAPRRRCASPAATTRSTSRRGPTCRTCARRRDRYRALLTSAAVTASG